MLFSAFTPLSLYRLSGEQPKAESIYNTLVAQHGSEFSLVPGTRQEAFCYMTALAVAHAMETQAHGALQNLVSEVGPMLPVREEEYRLVPGANDTFAMRVEAFAKAKVRPSAWTRTRIESALSELIGDGFYAYYPVPQADAVRSPPNLGDQPMNLQRADVVRKIIRITQPISIGLGADQTVTFELLDVPLDPSSKSSALPVDGDVFVIEPDIIGIGERVEIKSVDVASMTITALFNNAHTNGCLGFTHPYPAWVSSKRHNLVITTPAVAQNPAMRRRIDQQMRAMLRASSTWAIVQSSDGISTDAIESGTDPCASVKTLEAITF